MMIVMGPQPQVLRGLWIDLRVELLAGGGLLDLFPGLEKGLPVYVALLGMEEA